MRAETYGFITFVLAVIVVALVLNMTKMAPGYSFAIGVIVGFVYVIVAVAKKISTCRDMEKKDESGSVH